MSHDRAANLLSRRTGVRGIDVHKETYTVTCVCHTQIVKTATVPAEPASLAASLLRWFPGATLASAYEAGFSAFVLHRALTQVGITNIVVNPASIAVAANDKVKTDRRNSKRRASDLADGRLRGPCPYGSRGTGPVPPENPRAEGPTPRHDGSPDQSQVPPVWSDRPIQSALDQGPVCTGESPVAAAPGTRRWQMLLAEQCRFATCQLLEMRRLLRDQAKAQEEIEKVYRSVPGMGEVVTRT